MSDFLNRACFVFLFPFSHFQWKVPRWPQTSSARTDVCGKKTAENRSGGENRIYVIFVWAQPTAKVELWNIPNVLWNKSVVFKNTDTREDPWLQSTHILEVKVKVPSEVAVEDPRITDGRHRGYCPDLDIACSLVTTIYCSQSRPSPILDISRTAAATCHPLQLMFCQDLRISPCCRIFCKTTQQNRCWLFTRCHVSRGSVSRVTPPHCSLMRSVMDWGPGVGLVNIIAWARSRAVSHYQHHLLPAHKLQWSLDIYEGWAMNKHHKILDTHTKYSFDCR